MLRKVFPPSCLLLTLLALSGLWLGAQELKKKEKNLEPEDVLGFVHKYYNAGLVLTVTEEEEVKMSVSLGDGPARLNVSQGLLDLTQGDSSMLGFAMAHQLGHVYSFNRKIVYRDPDWQRERWNRAAREEEYRADRFAITLLSFSPDFITTGAKRFLLGSGRTLGDRGNFCHSLEGMFQGHEQRVFAPFTDRAEFVDESGRWISQNFVQTNASFWSNGINDAGRKRLIRDFQSIIPSMVCWPHC